MPPLREVREEIPLLANHFLNDYGKEAGRTSLRFSPEVLRSLATRDWPGNVRQLRNEVMRLAACSSGPVITDDLWEPGVSPIPVRITAAQPASVPRGTLKDAVEDLERRMIVDALQTTRNNQLQAARQLGLSRQGLINKMKRYEIG
jgi:DNA-binding NtrC family response regulator